jgi:hypothetical protein
MTTGGSLSRLLVACLATLALPSALAWGAQPCNHVSDAKVISILRTQGFASSTDSGTHVTFVGSLTARSGTCFIIYFYNHINIHPVQIAHGIQELIIIKNGMTYIGSYLLNVDDPVPTVAGSDLMFDLPAAEGNKIHFAHDGPPRTALVHGTILTLEK